MPKTPYLLAAFLLLVTASVAHSAAGSQQSAEGESEQLENQIVELTKLMEEMRAEHRRDISELRAQIDALTSDPNTLA